MRNQRWSFNAFFSSLLGMSGLLIPPACAVDKSEVLRGLEHSHYSLTREGLSELRCVAQPDWDTTVRSVHAEATSIQLREALKGARFEVAVGPGGASAVSRHFDTAPANAQAAEQMDNVAGGTEKVLSGFFQTWSQFMFESISTPKDEEYTLDESGGLYVLSQKQDSMLIVIRATREYLVKDLTISGSGVEAIFYPEFSRSNKGLLLTGYDATFRIPTTSGKPTEVITNMKIEYQDLQGLKLPSSIATKVGAGAMQPEISIRFTDCHVTKR